MTGKVDKDGGDRTQPHNSGDILTATSQRVITGTARIVRPETDEEARTRIKKQLFLEVLSKTRGVITIACDQTGIGRRTYYDWIEKDPAFAAAVNEVNADKNAIAEDILWGKITVEKDGPSIRFYLDRKHPNYKQRVKVETQVVDGRTLEDLLDEDS